jgi:hypothetical protein
VVECDIHAAFRESETGFPDDQRISRFTAQGHHGRSVHGDGENMIGERVKGYMKLENYFVYGTKIESAANKYSFV